MNLSFSSISRTLLGAALLVSITHAQDAVPSAKALAAQLDGAIQDNSSAVRLKMEISKPSGGAKTVLQLQVKSRRTKSATDIVYQVLWPKERKGESFLLRKSGDRAPTGSDFTLPDSLVPLTAAKMKHGTIRPLSEPRPWTACPARFSNRSRAAATAPPIRKSAAGST